MMPPPLFFWRESCVFLLSKKRNVVNVCALCNEALISHFVLFTYFS